MNFSCKLTFGLKTAPNIFQRSLNTVSTDYLHKWLVVYVDDHSVDSNWRGSPCKLFVVVSETGESWHGTLVGMQLKPSKCTFQAREIEILGHRITQEVRTHINNGVEAILSMHTATNISAVKCFLGLCGYFRDFIPWCLPEQKPCETSSKNQVSGQKKQKNSFETWWKPSLVQLWCYSIRIGTISFNHMWALASLGVELFWLRRRMTCVALYDFHPEHIHQLNHIG